jgi:hypothetical protein
VKDIGSVLTILAILVAFAVYPPAAYAAVIVVWVLVAFAGDTGG